MTDCAAEFASIRVNMLRFARMLANWATVLKPFDFAHGARSG
jgi:hypothetical protein